MKIVHATASFGFATAEHKEDFEFEDDATLEEIENELWEWANTFIDIGFEIEEETEE